MPEGAPPSDRDCPLSADWLCAQKKLQLERDEKEALLQVLQQKRGKSKQEVVSELTKALKRATKDMKAVRKVVIAARKAAAKN
jgi:hypothetical protein